MSTTKRVLVDDSSEEEIMYVMSNKTKNSIRILVGAFHGPFWQAKDGEEPDEESSEAEIFLLKTLCSSPGTLDVEKIMELLEDETNHLRVMQALYCLLGYDLSMEDVEEYLDSDEEVAEVRRVVRLLPRWAEVRPSKKSKC